MKKRRIFIALLVAILWLVLSVSPVLAIANPDSITMHTWKVFENIFETDDMLFVVSYDVAYASEPSEDVSDAFLFQIKNGATLLAQRPLNYYQYNVISIYLDATQAASLTWGTAYDVVITGNPALFGTITEGTNMVTRTLSGSDWIEGTESQSRELLRVHCLNLAEDLEDDWGGGITLVVETGDGTYLDEDGRIVFLAAIPSLDSAIPNLFQYSIGTIDIEKETATGAYDTELSMTNKAGTAIATAFSGIGDYIGVTGQTAGGLFIAMIALIVAGLVFFYSGNTVAAMVLATPIVIMGNWMGLVPLVITWIAAMIIVFYTAYHLYLRGI